MATCGFSKSDLEKILETKRTAFNKATREFRNRGKKSSQKTLNQQGKHAKTQSRLRINECENRNFKLMPRAKKQKR